MRHGVDDDVDPGVEFLAPASPDFDTCGRRAFKPGLDRATEDVLKRFQSVAAPG
jgi:hypothetical protein